MNHDNEAGITLANGRAVHEIRDRYVDEAIILWRMRRRDGSETHAVLGPRADGAIIVWFINRRPIGFREFSDWTSALGWSDQMQAQNWAVGWRLAPE